MTKFLFVTDLDNTLVGDDRALKSLSAWLDQQRALGTQVVYSTGRSRILYQELQAQANLLAPDILIASVGTEIYYAGQDTPDPAWSQHLAVGWSRDLVIQTTGNFPDLIGQPTTEQSPFKVSFFLKPTAAIGVLPALEQQLQQKGVQAQLIYSSGQDLDILPQQANKGAAMTFVRQALGFDPAATIVCGDSGNDIALFAAGDERGIIVGNAQAELLDWHHRHPSPYRYLATAHCAAGIQEGLQYFGFMPPV